MARLPTSMGYRRIASTRTPSGLDRLVQFARSVELPAQDDHVRAVQHLGAVTGIVVVAQQVCRSAIVQAWTVEPLTGVPARRAERFGGGHPDAGQRLDFIADPPVGDHAARVGAGVDRYAGFS